MRGLEFQDVFSMARILTKVDVANEIKSMAEKVQQGKKIDSADVGLEFVFTLIAKASAKDVEKEVYVFLADVLGVAIEDVRKMKPKELLEEFRSADAEEWRDFFMQAVSLISR